jgi:regulation of enolase protein 1 (concanavalin A-like superfamily)
MRCLSRVAVVVLFAGAVAAAPPPADKAGSKIAGWGEVIDPDGDCKASLDKGVLTITVPKTHHDLTYQEDVTKLNAPRVLQSVEGDFTLTVTVKAYPQPKGLESSSGKIAFVSAGLLVWQDDKNYARLERASVGQADDASLFAYMEYFADGKPQTTGGAEIQNKDTAFRVTRKGKSFTFEADDGATGKNWVELKSIEFPAAEKLKVGVHAINTATKEYAFQLTGLELKQAK